MGRGLLSTTDAPLAGTYLGVAGDPAVTALVEGSDGLLLLGVILSDTNFGVTRASSTCAAQSRRSTARSGWGFHQYPRHSTRGPLVDALLARAKAARPSEPGLPASRFIRAGWVADDAGYHAGRHRPRR